jgi:hypothetical protein
VIRFKSIISRIVILHVIAVAITSILMYLAMLWLLSIATNNIHNMAMEQQAESVANNLSWGGEMEASHLNFLPSFKVSILNHTGVISMPWSMIAEILCFRR